MPFITSIFLGITFSPELDTILSIFPFNELLLKKEAKSLLVDKKHYMRESLQYWIELLY